MHFSEKAMKYYKKVKDVPLQLKSEVHQILIPDM